MLSFQNAADSRDLHSKHAFRWREPSHVVVPCLFLGRREMRIIGTENQMETSKAHCVFFV